MKNQFEEIQKEFKQAMQDVKDISGLQALENRFFSRKTGEFTGLMKGLKELTGDMKKEMGSVANIIKKDLEEILEIKKTEMEDKEVSASLKEETIDVTQPKLPKKPVGHIHPTTQVIEDLSRLFESMGFMVLDGPELESEHYNFETVNIPADHPARDMQDTFFIKDKEGMVMRTQTSPVQTRAMQTYGAPLKMISIGRCFRNEATDARHEHTFYQIEGLVIGKNINFSQMKGVLETVFRHMFGKETQVRLRPKFYPFVEPGVNGEVTCYLCKGNGCKVCKKTGWLEVFGAGMTHPNVLKAGGVDPEEYSAFAFGFGLDRLVMLKYGVEDIRHFQSGDLRFLNQF